MNWRRNRKMENKSVAFRCFKCGELDVNCECKNKEIIEVNEVWLQCPRCKELGIDCCCSDVEVRED
jgi:hypothetical protein